MKKTRILRALLSIIIVLSILLDNGHCLAEKRNKGMILKKKPEYIFVGDTFKLSPKVKGEKVKFTYKSSNKKIATVNKKGKVKGKKKGKVKITITADNGMKKVVKLEVKSTDKLIMLTFDDGPGEHTERLLKAMKKNGYHGTFFMVGCQLTKRPAVAKKMVKNGNELGIHSWNHDAYAKLSTSAVEADVKRTRKLIKDCTGKKSVLVRPPYGSYNESTIQALKNTGCACIMWNTDIEDYKFFDAGKVEHNILTRVHPGAVLLVHDSHKWSVDAIISAMPKLKKQGYELVTVSEFARLKGLSLKPGQVIKGTSK